MHTTSQTLEKLSDCRSLLPAVLRSYEHTHGNGQRAPPTTLDTWKRVHEHCDFLCRRWEQALTGTIGNRFSSSESRTLVVNLGLAIERERKRVELTDDSMYKEDGQLSRWDRYKMTRDQQIMAETRRAEDVKADIYHRGNYFVAHGVEAYRAIRDLQKYAKGRGWSTDEDFGEILGDEELEYRKKISKAHLLAVRDGIRKECTSTSKHVWDEILGNDSHWAVHGAAGKPEAKIHDGYVEIDWVLG